jgi:subtilisin family serine protease
LNGVACEARILAAKVLSNAGSGSDGQILAGMAWAVAHGAWVISMSLGAKVRPGELFPQTYEQLALRALSRGTVIVAAAGNGSQRPRASCRPANCPSILAVTALAKAFTTSFFSNGGINGQGGEINIAAPGRDVRSAAPWRVPEPERHQHGHAARGRRPVPDPVSESSHSRAVGVILAVGPDRFADVIEALERTGLTAAGEQPLLGTLSGTVAEDRIPAL